MKQQIFFDCVSSWRKNDQKSFINYSKVLILLSFLFPLNADSLNYSTSERQMKISQVMKMLLINNFPISLEFSFLCGFLLIQNIKFNKAIKESYKLAVIFI